MKLIKTWIVIVLISVGIFCIGKLENSHLITFIGVMGIAAGGICEVSHLVMQFIKLHSNL